MGEACASKTSPAGLLDHIDTISAAKDLDILRGRRSPSREEEKRAQQWCRGRFCPDDASQVDIVLPGVSQVGGR